MKQSIVTLDMEGVLTPEIWIAVARATGIERLRLTTRDVPDYDVLMRGRLAVLEEHELTLSEIQSVIGRLHPLPGALEFLRELRSFTQVIILSDTFEQFAQPLLRQLEWPTLFCHQLRVENDRILDYQLRIPNQKRATVDALRSLNYRVIAAGDSYNDMAMLAAADAGILFRPPAKLRSDYPAFPAVRDHAGLIRMIRKAYDGV
ncbi:MAG TPA: bifunctional phosphoserine phosphatase/homoserine phosphotransferase ThrH [Verrucomicrobiota bacterium]|nr:bifunctional phosphoserine phosphatase/homoserine phosphotransferase ThrH [Verrucomicrobiota bacterium]HNU51649.1 bifunctional phosphoserine phosphatase/homoserine phosphotransferase ThrH [Verrucomicrobiota bacterium]